MRSLRVLLATDQDSSDAGPQSTGPIPAFLQPSAHAQPEAEAKAMASSLAATAAANAKQQEHAVHAVVQVSLQPVFRRTGAMPGLQQPFLSCPATMQV